MRVVFVMRKKLIGRFGILEDLLVLYNLKSL